MSVGAELQNRKEKARQPSILTRTVDREARAPTYNLKLCAVP